MDHQRFDEIVRSLAAPRDRRSALRVIGGGIAAGLGVMLARRGATSAGNCALYEFETPACFWLDGAVCWVPWPQAADEAACIALDSCSEGGGGQSGGGCYKWSTSSEDEEVCSGEGETCGRSPRALGVPCCAGLTCVEGICATVCAEAGAACASDTDCCGDLTCVEGICTAPVVCGVEGDACSNLDGGEEDPCCAGYTCGNEGRCVPVDDEVECETDADCFGGASGNPPICCAGVCRDLQCCIDDEDPNARCPEGTSCFEGICEEIVCGHDGDACDDDQDCCGHLVCAEGTCAHPVDDGGDDDDHDGGHDGNGGEPVTQLPNTGVAGEAGNGGLIAGAALAAGAAALLAGTRLRPTGETSDR